VRFPGARKALLNGREPDCRKWGIRAEKRGKTCSYEVVGAFSDLFGIIGKKGLGIDQQGSERRDHRDRLTGDVHRKGEVWTVLKGSKEGRIDVWFRQPDGKSHTWDDDAASIDEWFERLEDRKNVRTRKSTVRLRRP
jgi:hypothetical protein